MTMDWPEAFEGPLSEYVPDSSSDHARIPWPVIDQADPNLGDRILRGEHGLDAAEEALRQEYGQPTPIRLYDLPESNTYRVGKYGSAELGKVIAVRGRVVSVDGVTPFAKEAAFECVRCGTLTYIPQAGGELIEPVKCKGCEDDVQFRLNIQQSSVVDLQRVYLERPESSMDDPPVEMVQLWRDLCETLSKDDVVTVVGVYDVLPGQDDPELDTFLDAVSIDKSEKPATVDEIADWRVKKWAYETVDELSESGSSYDCSKREVVEAVSDEHGVAEGEITTALSDLDDQSAISNHQSDRIHITTSTPPTFEPDE
jgi:DNA replicative helicase MCM subunit Mcm2 (Cdc46/Mcm family)